MSARTNPDDVAALLGDNYDGVTDLSGFIDTASAIVDQVVTMAAEKAGGGTGNYTSRFTLTAAVQELIERWLAAHNYALMDPLYMSKSTGGASASFQRQAGMGFESTEYGRMAIRLDFSGCLNNIDKQQFASCDWLGKAPSVQIPYMDRN